MIGARVVNVLWAILIFCGSLSGAQQTQDSRLVKAISARIQAAQVMPDVLAKVTAQYADDFWPLAVDKELMLDKPAACMAAIGQRCLLVAQGNKVRVFDVKTGQKKDVASPDGTPITAIMHQSNFDVITGDVDGQIWRWNIKTGKPHGFRPEHDQAVHSLAWMENQDCVVSASASTVCSWTPGVDYNRRVFSKETTTSILPMDDLVVVGLSDGSIRSINVKTNDVNQLAQGRKEPVTALARISSRKIAAQYGTCIDMIDLGAHAQPICLMGGGIQNLTALEDELVGPRHIIGNRSGADRFVICRIKHGSKDVVADSLELPGHVEYIAASPAGNWFAAAASVVDILGEAAYPLKKQKIHIVQRVGDDVPEEKIDDEFVQWMNERPAATAVEPAPIVEQKPRKKKHDSCACS